MKTKQKRILWMVAVVFVLLIGGTLILYNLIPKEKLTYEISSRKTEFANAKKTNDKTVGWVRIEGTNIDYPIQLGTNAKNENYKDIIWTNDTVDQGTRQVILGHNLLNVTSKPLVGDARLSRFEDLMSYVYEYFTKNHLYIQLTDENGEEALYKIYAVSFYNLREDVGTSYYEEKEIENYISEVRNKSWYQFDVDVNTKDELITLATCTRFYGEEDQNHFKVDARKLRKNEKAEKYSLKTTENYVIIK